MATDKLANIVIGLVTIAVIIAAAFLIMGNLRSSTDKETISVINETGGWVNTTAYTVDTQSEAGFGSLSVVTIINTTGVIILPGNYTVNATAGTITGTGLINWSNVNLTYSYARYTDSQNQVTTVITATRKIPAFLGIIILVMILVIVIGYLNNLNGKKTENTDF